jgi:hypothetical protein
MSFFEIAANNYRLSMISRTHSEFVHLTSQSHTCTVRMYCVLFCSDLPPSQGGRYSGFGSTPVQSSNVEDSSGKLTVPTVLIAVHSSIYGGQIL